MRPVRWRAVSEAVCLTCGTPTGGEQRRGVLTCCDEICLAVWQDRQPSGHFANEAFGPLCGRRYTLGKEHPSGDLVLCDTHQRLALREIAWRQREGHDPYGHLNPPSDKTCDPWEGVA